MTISPDDIPINEAPAIRGEPLSLDEMLDFTALNLTDVERAAEWWDEHATPAWVGILDRKPLNGKSTARQLRLR